MYTTTIKLNEEKSVTITAGREKVSSIRYHIEEPLNIQQSTISGTGCITTALFHTGKNSWEWNERPEGMQDAYEQDRAEYIAAIPEKVTSRSISALPPTDWYKKYLPTDEELEQVREARKTPEERAEEEREVQEREERCQKAEEERKQEAERSAQAREELIKKYDFLTPVAPGGYASAALASKNIKRLLSRMWPDVKFSVRSETFSGGDSVNVTWTDGPQSKDVDAVINDFQDGGFDAMTDCSYHVSNDMHVFGSAKFVHSWREISAAEVEKYIPVVTEAVNNLEKGKSETIGNTGYGIRRDHGERFDIWDTTREYMGNSWGIKGVAEMIARNEINVPAVDIWAAPVAPAAPAAPEVAPAAPVAGGVTISHNEEKNGIEVSFPTRPEADKIEWLKNHSFRWSRFNKIWYRKYSPAAMEEARRYFAPVDTAESPAAVSYEPDQEAASEMPEAPTEQEPEEEEEIDIPLSGCAITPQDMREAALNDTLGVPAVASIPPAETRRNVREAIEAEEDFEFYPTTDEIIADFIDCIGYWRSDDGRKWWNCRHASVLDIGAGNGKVLMAVSKLMPDVELYAIEKAATLRAALDPKIYVIGTDFLEQSLIDKTPDVIFCNPPYSQYEQWTDKIIREASAKEIYLVIPSRFEDSEQIAEALEYRGVKDVRKMGVYSFLNSPDRAARATVNLVKISLEHTKRDSFDCLFKEEFKDFVEKFEGFEEPEEHAAFDLIEVGEGYIKALVEMYRREIAKIKRNYGLLSGLDVGLMKEFGITPTSVQIGLKEKLKGLKNVYWKEILSRCESVTSRVISSKRQRLVERLQEHGKVDFTEENIYAVILWLLKNTNGTMDEQLVEVYEKFINKANIRNYKSNKKVYGADQWRYGQEKPTHVYLDYRIIQEGYYGLKTEWESGPLYSLRQSGCDRLQDLMIIARNLGFECSPDYRINWWSSDKTWSPGKPEEFHCNYHGEDIVLMEVKAHKNGNLHIRMNQKFALALNVEYGRLKGWIHSKEQAADEIKDPKAGQYYKSNLTLLASAVLPMLEHRAEAA